MDSNDRENIVLALEKVTVKSYYEYAFLFHREHAFIVCGFFLII